MGAKLLCLIEGVLARTVTCMLKAFKTCVKKLSPVWLPITEKSAYMYILLYFATRLHRYTQLKEFPQKGHISLFGDILQDLTNSLHTTCFDGVKKLSQCQKKMTE